MQTTAQRQYKYYHNNQGKCVCRKILKNIREKGGAPMEVSLKKYPDILTPDILFANFKKYIQTETDQEIAEKKTDIFLQRVRPLLMSEDKQT